MLETLLAAILTGTVLTWTLPDFLFGWTRARRRARAHQRKTRVHP